MGDKAKIIKKGVKNLNKLKKIEKTAKLVKKGVGTGVQVLEYTNPDAAQKVNEKLDSFQDKLNKYEDPVEKVADYMQEKIDHLIGDKVETFWTMWMIESNIMDLLWLKLLSIKGRKNIKNP